MPIQRGNYINGACVIAIYEGIEAAGIQIDHGVDEDIYPFRCDHVIL